MTENTAPTTSTPAAPAADTPTNAGGIFTAAQLETMAGDLVNRGRLTREQADAMLRADGVPAATP